MTATAKEKVRNEVSILAQYFLIAFVASSVAYGIFESAQRTQTTVESSNVAGDQVSINIAEMLASMWNGYYRWWVGVFIGLSAIRLLILYGVGHFSEKHTIQ